MNQEYRVEVRWTKRADGTWTVETVIPGTDDVLDGIYDSTEDDLMRDTERVVRREVDAVRSTYGTRTRRGAGTPLAGQPDRPRRRPRPGPADDSPLTRPASWTAGERVCSQCGCVTSRHNTERGAVVCVNCEVEMRYGLRKFVAPEKGAPAHEDATPG